MADQDVIPPNPGDEPAPLPEAVKKAKMRFSWRMAVVVVVVFFAFVALIAFGQGILGRPLVDGGLFSVGMALGLLAMGASIGATALYALRINRMEAEAQAGDQHSNNPASTNESESP